MYILKARYTLKLKINGANMMRIQSTLLLTCLAIAFATCEAVSAAEASEFPSGMLVDMSYAFDENTVYWPTAAGFEKTTDFEGDTEGGYYYSACLGRLSLSIFKVSFIESL